MNAVRTTPLARYMPMQKSGAPDSGLGLISERAPRAECQRPGALADRAAGGLRGSWESNQCSQGLWPPLWVPGHSSLVSQKGPLNGLLGMLPGPLPNDKP